MYQLIGFPRHIYMDKKIIKVRYVVGNKTFIERVTESVIELFGFDSYDDFIKAFTE